jgi:hypothetical protein
MSETSNLSLRAHILSHIRSRSWWNSFLSFLILIFFVSWYFYDMRGLTARLVFYLIVSALQIIVAAVTVRNIPEATPTRFVLNGLPVGYVLIRQTLNGLPIAALAYPAVDLTTLVQVEALYVIVSTAIYVWLYRTA